MSEYLIFREVPTVGRKTKIVEVRSTLHGDLLGQIRSREGEGMSEPPADIVEGSDPVYAEFTLAVVQAVQGECACGYKMVGTQEVVTADLRQHIALWHQASRNPELTCHAGYEVDRLDFRTKVTIYNSWCVRPKGHEGKHWTPSAGGGMEWG